MCDTSNTLKLDIPDLGPVSSKESDRQHMSKVLWLNPASAASKRLTVTLTSYGFDSCNKWRSVSWGLEQHARSQKNKVVHGPFPLVYIAS